MSAFSEGSLFVTTVSRYAYETISNKSIITGEMKSQEVITLHSGSLGGLATVRKAAASVN